MIHSMFIYGMLYLLLAQFPKLHVVPGDMQDSFFALIGIGITLRCMYAEWAGCSMFNMTDLYKSIASFVRRLFVETGYFFISLFLLAEGSRYVHSTFFGINLQETFHALVESREFSQVFSFFADHVLFVVKASIMILVIAASVFMFGFLSLVMVEKALNSQWIQARITRLPRSLRFILEKISTKL